jgi:hypothetical protein
MRIKLICCLKEYVFILKDAITWLVLRVQWPSLLDTIINAVLNKVRGDYIAVETIVFLKHSPVI